MGKGVRCEPEVSNEYKVFKTGNGPDMSGPKYDQALKALYGLHGVLLKRERRKGPKRRRRNRS